MSLSQIVESEQEMSEKWNKGPELDSLVGHCFFFLQQVCFYPILQQLQNDVWYCSVEQKPLLVQFI